MPSLPEAIAKMAAPKKLMIEDVKTFHTIINGSEEYDDVDVYFTKETTFDDSVMLQQHVGAVKSITWSIDIADFSFHFSGYNMEHSYEGRLTVQWRENQTISHFHITHQGKQYPVNVVRVQLGDPDEAESLAIVTDSVEIVYKDGHSVKFSDYT